MHGACSLTRSVNVSVLLHESCLHRQGGQFVTTCLRARLNIDAYKVSFAYCQLPILPPFFMGAHHSVN